MVILNPEQAEVISEIEKILARSIPTVSNPSDYAFGMKIENDLITNLSLIYARLETLPASIGNLKSLQNLNLNYNNFKTLPESIGNLTSLQILNLGYNNLDQLPESITHLSNLTNLRLNNNRLKKLPETIGKLNKLRTLDLSFNYLESLPKSFCDMASLRELKLFENNIKKLPQNLGGFERLRILDVRFNSLVNVPESIGDIIPLKSLQLCCNSIKNLPKSVANLKYMKDLNLMGNRILDLDPKIIDVFEKIKKKKDLPEILKLQDNPIYEKHRKLKKIFGLEKIDYYIEPINPLSWEDKLRRIIDIYGLSKYRDKILEAIGYRFPMIKHYVKEDKNIDTGLSKLGGYPDLPKDFEWPYWNNRPLSFLLQVNLEDFINFDKNPFTAESGMIYFFYDPLHEDWGWGAGQGKNQGAWRVIYIKEDKSNLIRLMNPSKIREYTFPTCLVSFYQDIHFPSRLLSGEESNEIIYTPDFFIDSPLKEIFFIRHPYMRFQIDFFDEDFGFESHFLFGYPDEIQELGRREGWCHLLQLNEDSMLRWTWGHNGKIHFMIRETDLKRNNYDDVHLELDSY